jgi:electron transfer flavoprotein beta subunit
MKIAVFTRYCPDPVTVELTEGGKLDTERLLYKLGRGDLIALEQAVQLAEANDGKVVAFCVAPPAADKILKSLYAGGASEVIRLWDGSSADTALSEIKQAQLLAGAIRAGAFDLVIGGAVGSEGNSDVLGPALAAYLNWPQVGNVARLELRSSNRLYAEPKLERGEREGVICPLPALLTMAEGGLEPRYPSMPAYLASLRHPVEYRPVERVAAGAEVRYVGLTPPRPRPKKLPRPADTLPYFRRIDAILAVTGGDKKGNIFEGSPDELAERIVAFLVSNKLL